MPVLAACRPSAAYTAHRRLLAALVAPQPDAEALTWRVAQFDTLRLRLGKLAMRVAELKTRVTLHLLAACPEQAIIRVLLDPLPHLAC